MKTKTHLLLAVILSVIYILLAVTPERKSSTVETYPTSEFPKLHLTTQGPSGYPALNH